MDSVILEPPVKGTASAVWLDSRQVAEHSRLSLKTLLRANAAGEEVGLRKVGVKLVFNRELLDAWLLSKTAK